jgi:hypothetical protein
MRLLLILLLLTLLDLRIASRDHRHVEYGYIFPRRYGHPQEVGWYERRPTIRRRRNFGGERYGGGGEEYAPSSSSSPRLVDLSPLAVGTVLKSINDMDDEFLVLLDPISGSPHGNVKGVVGGGGVASSSTSIPLSAKVLLDAANVRRPRGKATTTSRLIDAVALDGDRIGVWVGWSMISSEDVLPTTVTALSYMAYVELAIESSSSSSSIGTYRIVRASPLSIGQSTSSSSHRHHTDIGIEAFVLSSTRIVVRRPQGGGGGGSVGGREGVGEGRAGLLVTIIAISTNRRRLILASMEVESTTSTSSSSSCVVKRGRAIEIDALHPYYRRISSINVDEEGVDGMSGGMDGMYHVVRVSGIDDR